VQTKLFFLVIISLQNSGPSNSFHCLGHSKNVYDDDDDDDVLIRQTLYLCMPRRTEYLTRTRWTQRYDPVRRPSEIWTKMDTKIVS